MAVKLHRCSFTFLKVKSHGCWQVEKALQDAGVDYERVTRVALPRSKRTDIIAGTGQAMMPAIEFEDGTWYRAESKEMAERIRAGKLFEGREP
ncbi:MAG: glutathione S-transferase domain-containing protein [Thermoleophilia bacterium]|nr:glutathione S-transferase domain-containing protein [Thermoleophilia bacterium]